MVKSIHILNILNTYSEYSESVLLADLCQSTEHEIVTRRTQALHKGVVSSKAKSVV